MSKPPSSYPKRSMLESSLRPGVFDSRVLEYLSDADIENMRAASGELKSAIDTHARYTPFPHRLIHSPDRWSHTRRGEKPGHFKVFLSRPAPGETWDQTERDLEDAMTRCHAIGVCKKRVCSGVRVIPPSLAWVRRLGYNIEGFDLHMWRYVIPGPTSLPDVWWLFHVHQLFAIVVEGRSSWSDDADALELLKSNVQEDPDKYPHVLQLDEKGLPIEYPDPFFVWLESERKAGRRNDTMVSNLPMKAALREQFDIPGVRRLWICVEDIDHMFVQHYDVREDARSIDVVDSWTTDFDESEFRNKDSDGEEGIPTEYENLDELPERAFVNGSLNPAFVEWMASNNLRIAESPADLFEYGYRKTVVLDFVMLTEPLFDTHNVHALRTLSTDVMLSQKERRVYPEEEREEDGDTGGEEEDGDTGGEEEWDEGEDEGGDMGNEEEEDSLYNDISDLWEILIEDE